MRPAELNSGYISVSAVTATVRNATYLGSHWEVTLETEVGTIHALQPVGLRIAPGDTMELQLKTDELTIVAPTNGQT